MIQRTLKASQKHIRGNLAQVIESMRHEQGAESRMLNATQASCTVSAPHSRVLTNESCNTVIPR